MVWTLIDFQMVLNFFFFFQSHFILILSQGHSCWLYVYFIPFFILIFKMVHVLSTVHARCTNFFVNEINHRIECTYELLNLLVEIKSESMIKSFRAAISIFHKVWLFERIYTLCLVKSYWCVYPSIHKKSTSLDNEEKVNNLTCLLVIMITRRIRMELGLSVN